MQKNIFFAFLLLTLSSFFWSGNFFTGKLAFNYSLSPFKLSFFRWVLAFLILLPFTFADIKKNFYIYKKNFILMISLSFLGVAIFNSFTYISLQTTLVINASLMTSIAPVLIIGFSLLIFKTKTTNFQFVGIFLSLFGVLCIVLKGDISNLFNLYFISGDIWMFVAVFSWALYSVLLKKIDQKLKQLATLQVMIIIGSIIILPFYIYESFNTNNFFPNKITDIYMIAYVAIFAGIVSFFCWNRGVSIIGANRASLFLHLIPVFSSIWAIFFLDEIFSFYHLIGAIFIVLGIILSNYKINIMNKIL
jgi:drug/metabolite transporter (DMT)-like permease